MDFFRWLKPKREPEEIPSTRVGSVSIEKHQIVCRWKEGHTRRFTLERLGRVLIRTTDKGAFDEDVFFVLELPEGECVIPQNAEGSNDLLKLLKSLDGFDNKAVVAAMSSTRNREFICWTRKKISSPFSRSPDF